LKVVLSADDDSIPVSIPSLYTVHDIVMFFNDDDDDDDDDDDIADDKTRPL
jgi:hypothetical protein